MEEEKKYPRVFKKAIKGSVGGRFINDRGKEDEFLLKGDPQSADIELITVEVKTADDEKYFMRNNKKALIQGYLIEITEGYEITFDEVNSVSDGYLKDLLKVPFASMKKRVDEFTSPIPVDRLLVYALDMNKPVKTIEFLRGALAKLTNRTVPSTGEIDGIKIGGTA